VGEDNYAHGGRVVFLPLMGWGVLYCNVLRGINGKRNQTDLSTKKRFANAIKLFLCGICPDGFVLSMKKMGLEKLTKKTMKTE
jgi:hypothetical protein